MDKQKRIEIAIKCKDAEYIPKVSNAGEIVDGERPFQIMHNGIKIYLDSHYGDFNTTIMKHLKGIHEPQEEKVFYEVLKVIPKNATMLELGSFWAYYSIWFNSEIENAQNYMVEPVVNMMQKGIDNFELNNMNGDFTSACVGDSSKDSIDFEDWDKSKISMKQICVDDFLEEKRIEYLNILHTDIQGAEFNMLKGAQKSFNKNMIGFVFISTHSEEIHFNCLNFIKSNNFNIIAEHTPNESYSTDGLITAVHKSIKFPKVKISKRTRFNRLVDRIINSL